jgi:hypothetical protein
MAREPWKLTNIVWLAVVAALLPLRLHEIESSLQSICARLESYDTDRSVYAPRQLELFRRTYVGGRVRDG